jgi:tetratricopeptide (TPR) repeat protein
LLRRYERTGDRSDLDQAIAETQQAIAATPADHPSRAGLLYNLSVVLRIRFGETDQRSDLDQAVNVAELAVAASSTVAARNNLADAYESAGRISEAIPLYQQTLADAERVLGPDHPDTLAARSNLAGAYRQAGRISEAIPLYQQTLADAERVLGPDHPQTLAFRNNLAAARELTGL